METLITNWLKHGLAHVDSDGALTVARRLGVPDVYRTLLATLFFHGITMFNDICRNAGYDPKIILKSAGLDQDTGYVLTD